MNGVSGPKHSPRDSNGWDGKLRISDLKGDEPEDGPTPPDSDNDESNIIDDTNVQQIEADEDLLDDVPLDETDIDLNHLRIASIPKLRLERFNHLQRLCLRQNHVSEVAFPPAPWGDELSELDLYDNAIGHVRGFDDLTNLKSLDLSFNKIKHIKHVDHLKSLTDLYFVQNKISKIENLEGLAQLKNLELAANRIREIEGLDSLKNLQELWLGKNKITELKGLAPLSNLRLLSIQSNRLTSASLAHLASVPKLEELYLSHNAIEDISKLSSCTNLTTLDVSSNPITSIAGLKPMKGLEEVWASDCQLGSFEEIEEQLHDKQQLRTVYFEGNPLQRRQPALYRNKVRLALPQVIQIDATYVRVA